jgi:hypothetical protein
VADERRSLWITYAWVDDASGDFSYVVQRLEQTGVHAKYDRRMLVAGQRLWEQIAAQISSPSTDGWAMLLTQDSICNQRCLEEHAYALDRALHTRGADFPLIGLLHSVRPEELPDLLMPLRVRLCISLSDPQWPQQVAAGLRGEPLGHEPRPQSAFVWAVHRRPQEGPTAIAVEVRPRFGEVLYWRFAVPIDSTIVSFGRGPVGAVSWGGSARDVVEGTLDLSSEAAKFVGQGDALSPSASAYVCLLKPPKFVAFGAADAPFGVPVSWEVLSPSAPQV